MKDENKSFILRDKNKSENNIDSKQIDIKSDNYTLKKYRIPTKEIVWRNSLYYSPQEILKRIFEFPGIQGSLDTIPEIVTQLKSSLDLFQLSMENNQKYDFYI